MTDLGAALDAWRRRRDAFRWETPDRFNFGTDVVDRLAAEPARPALLWRGENGAERRLAYADVARAANRFAHLLASLGVRPGDPVVVMLPKVGGRLEEAATPVHALGFTPHPAFGPILSGQLLLPGRKDASNGCCWGVQEPGGESFAEVVSLSG